MPRNNQPSSFAYHLLQLTIAGVKLSSLIFLPFVVDKIPGDKKSSSNQQLSLNNEPGFNPFQITTSALATFALCEAATKGKTPAICAATALPAVLATTEKNEGQKPDNISTSSGLEDTSENYESFYDPNSIFATSALDSYKLFQNREIVSHVTQNPNKISELTGGKIKLHSHPKNLYGGNTFHTSIGTYEFVYGKATVFYEIDRSALKSITEHSPEYIELLEKYGMTKYFNHFSRRNKLPSFLKQHGYNAIKYEGDINTDCYAIIDQPNRILKPIGAYPASNQDAGLISLRTVKGIRALGNVGLAYSLYHSGKTIAESDEPLKETAHQTTLLGVSMAAGAEAASLAMPACLTVGAACPPAAWGSVPACLLVASVAGSTIATIGTEYLWNSVMKSDDTTVVPSLSEFLIPSAEAATPANTDYTQYFDQKMLNNIEKAKEVLNEPDKLEEASPETLLNAINIQKAPDNFFNINTESSKLDSNKIHKAFQQSINNNNKISTNNAIEMTKELLNRREDLINQKLKFSLDKAKAKQTNDASTYNNAEDKINEINEELNATTEDIKSLDKKHHVLSLIHQDAQDNIKREYKKSTAFVSQEKIELFDNFASISNSIYQIANIIGNKDVAKAAYIGAQGFQMISQASTLMNGLQAGVMSSSALLAGSFGVAVMAFNILNACGVFGGGGDNGMQAIMDYLKIIHEEIIAMRKEMRKEIRDGFQKQTLVLFHILDEIADGFEQTTHHLRFSILKQKHQENEILSLVSVMNHIGAHLLLSRLFDLKDELHRHTIGLLTSKDFDNAAFYRMLELENYVTRLSSDNLLVGMANDNFDNLKDNTSISAKYYYDSLIRCKNDTDCLQNKIGFLFKYHQTYLSNSKKDIRIMNPSIFHESTRQYIEFRSLPYEKVIKYDQDNSVISKFINIGEEQIKALKMINNNPDKITLLVEQVENHEYNINNELDSFREEAQKDFFNKCLDDAKKINTDKNQINIELIQDIDLFGNINDQIEAINNTGDSFYPQFSSQRDLPTIRTGHSHANQYKCSHNEIKKILQENGRASIIPKEILFAELLGIAKIDSFNHHSLQLTIHYGIPPPCHYSIQSSQDTPYIKYTDGYIYGLETTLQIFDQGELSDPIFLTFPKNEIPGFREKNHHSSQHNEHILNFKKDNIISKTQIMPQDQLTLYTDITKQLIIKKFEKYRQKAADLAEITIQESPDFYQLLLKHQLILSYFLLEGIPTDIEPMQELINLTNEKKLLETIKNSYINKDKIISIEQQTPSTMIFLTPKLSSIIHDIQKYKIEHSDSAYSEIESVYQDAVLSLKKLKGILLANKKKQEEENNWNKNSTYKNLLRMNKKNNDDDNNNELLYEHLLKFDLYEVLANAYYDEDKRCFMFDGKRLFGIDAEHVAEDALKQIEDEWENTEDYEAIRKLAYEALKRSPKHPILQFHIAQTWLLEGKYTQAYRSFLKIDFNQIEDQNFQLAIESGQEEAKEHLDKLGINPNGFFATKQSKTLQIKELPDDEIMEEEAQAQRMKNGV